MRELRCNKEIAKNGGVPTRIRTGSKVSGFIRKKKWPFCWDSIGKSEKKGAENEPAAGVLFCAPQATILRNRGPKNRDPSEKCNHFGVRLEQIGMGF